MRVRGRHFTAVALAIAALAALTIPAAAQAPARMLVTSQEYSFILSRGSVPRGAVTVQLYNRGQDPHNLNIRRLGAGGRMVGPTQSLRTTQPGSLSQATWHLAPGRYELYCSLPQHIALGMRAYLTVR